MLTKIKVCGHRVQAMGLSIVVSVTCGTRSVTETVFIDLLQKALWLILLLAAPVLLVNLLVGIAISIFQAVTQIQEATLTFVPKLLSSFVILVLLGPWMTRMIISYSNDVFNELVVMAKSNAKK